nr:MAG TPA: hypothetical protein [Bacteriophage sp.]
MFHTLCKIQHKLFKKKFFLCDYNIHNKVMFKVEDTSTLFLISSAGYSK